MSSFLVAIVSIAVGVFATIFVSRYYFRRTTEKSLTPYIQFSTSVFQGVEPDLRDSLKISYQGVPITDLYEIQFLVANTGYRSIRDVINPLTLVVPEECDVLDAGILHVYPEGREVDVTVDPADVMFKFPVLNADEFFIAKILLKGDASAKDFSFRITADDLPPVLTPDYLTQDLIDTGEKAKFEPGLLAAGVVVSATAAALSWLIYQQFDVLWLLLGGGLLDALRGGWAVLLSVSVAAIPTLIFLVVGPMLLVGSFTNFSFPKRRRFHVPSDFRRTPYDFQRLFDGDS